MVIFEIGSLICAVAPTSPVFIFGRAIAGLGGAGMFSGGKLNCSHTDLYILPRCHSLENSGNFATNHGVALIIIIHVAPPEKRAAYSGMIVGMIGISSVVGPLIGGALTSQVSWRWCFYINLPPGGVAIAGINAFFRTPKRTTTTSDAGTGFVAKLAKFDPFGAACLLACVVCLLLALQLRGITYQFSNGRIVALFVLFVVLLTAFIAIQFRWSENATVPSGVLKQRSILSGSFYVFCIGGHFFTLVYFLPIWFQGVRGQSALESGNRHVAYSPCADCLHCYGRCDCLGNMPLYPPGMGVCGHDFARRRASHHVASRLKHRKMDRVPGHLRDRGRPRISAGHICSTDRPGTERSCHRYGAHGIHTKFWRDDIYLRRQQYLQHKAGSQSG